MHRGGAYHGGMRLHSLLKIAPCSLLLAFMACGDSDSNNVILRTDNGIMITTAGQGGPRRNISIYNNTIYEGNDEWFNGIWVMTKDAKNVVIRNNIVVSHYNVAKIMAADPALESEITVDHNLVFGPESCLDGYADCLLLSTLPGNTTADPGFVDAEGGDLHLGAGSPAVDQGVAMPGLVDDVEGTTRPQGAAVDVGAYERVD